VKYRKFGKLEWKVSALGFGAMRLPTLGADPAKIDEPQAIRMVRYAIDRGVNYVDTAYPYHGGKSESFVRKALQDGYDKKVKIATKMPTWLIHSQEDMDKYLGEQLRRLGVKQIDFYLLHALNNERWQTLLNLNVFSWLEKKRDEGKIKYFGFSFHDEYPVFKKIVDSYAWTFCQIHYNYVDSLFQAGQKGLRYAASKGLAVVVMEPIAGGRLGSKPPKDIQTLWDKSEIKRTPAEWALQWVWNQPEVSVVLSGMSTLQQVRENVNSANRSSSNILTRKELQLINIVGKKYREIGYVPCSGCRYCQPCPQGVMIPQIIALYNEYYMKARDEHVKKKYQEQISLEGLAKKCIKCGKCEEVCPQKVNVRRILGEVAFVFETPP
jgi:predicted aldo/keto reductase-like oxidoreductase